MIGRNPPSSLSGAVLTLLILLPGVPIRSDSADQYPARGNLAGLERIDLRVPSRGGYRLDVRALYYEARDFLAPRAPGLTLGAREAQGTLEVAFQVLPVPPESEPKTGWMLISWGSFASRSDRLGERGYTGTGEPPTREVAGLVLWHSAPEVAWVTDESDLPGRITEQMQFHLNGFLDAWFRDNPH